ncbi:TPA: hypothetical protein RY214_004786 [Pseudomonas aeruginosa]|uniref:hypothetical protein n=1 Tax=Pseudomonas aeruginosa group TaxID=136841 RepID=UPI000CFC51A5|nr:MULTISPECIES: hypothetical protein [Pseudomonas aeruginosa group]EKX0430339.1 hypothetical protein [Pseudomonas aeruginosa]MCV0038357.1 hypothetical protein [Pseudomonas aeruginosa]MDS9770491.1 hypothetical protein [Pseudomonas aeruginosa]HCE5829621.1 hypothetical protein [Pseudomonas aeruginosa]HCF7071142.1 hypothetical protein [Pseudomonas aeruginosa]
MKQVGSTWIPFFKGDSSESGIAASTQRINELIAEHEIRVINVETVYRTSWLGRPIEPCGLRVWWESERLTATELTQPLFDAVNN